MIELRPRRADHSAARTPDPAVGTAEDTVVLGRSVPYRTPAAVPTSMGVPVAASPVEHPGPFANPVIDQPLVDHSGVYELLARRHEGHHSAPPPPRVQHRPWFLSSILIAGGGVLAVMIAGELTPVPLVATIALLATVLCGAILVAAQVTQEVGRARRGPAWSAPVGDPPLR